MKIKFLLFFFDIMNLRLPVLILSMHITLCPLPRKWSQRWLPIKPAPPEIRVVRIILSMAVKIIRLTNHLEFISGLIFFTQQIGLESSSV